MESPNHGSHDKMAGKGMRVLESACVLGSSPNETAEKALERNLTLVGLFGMIDPPRPEVREPF